MLDRKTRQDYQNTIDDFQHITNLAVKLYIKTTGREVNSWREECASYTFAKICMHAISLLKLRFKFPKSITTSIDSVWDISSIAVLTRSIIDSYYVFYYLSIDKCTKAELEFRRDLWNYHGEYHRFDMLKRIKSKNPKLKELEKYIDTQKAKIVNSSFYKSIPSRDLQRDIKKGKIAILLSNSKLSERAGIDPDFYKAEFNSLSAYTHGHPFAFTQLKLFRVNDNKSLSLVTNIFQICTGYVCYAVRDFVKLFPDQIENLDVRSKGLVDHWVYEFRNF